MGVYLHPGNDAFQESLNSEIYMDKSKLIAYTNRVLETERKYLCVSRPRRFGKSMAAKMLAAYYDKTCDSHAMFQNLQIASDPSFGKQLNQSSVLYLDISWFRVTARSSERVVDVLQKEVIDEFRAAFPAYISDDDNSLPLVLANINKETGEKFVIIIDEWDCLFREDRLDAEVKSKDDVITLLIHLGYLAYDASRQEAFIPNQEVADEFENAIEEGGWGNIAHALQDSEELLYATLQKDADAVAKGIDKVHTANSSVLAYNNELSLSCTITLAYYSARRDYTMITDQSWYLWPSGRSMP